MWSLQGRGNSFECETCFGQTSCVDDNCPAGYEQNQLGKGCNVDDTAATFKFTNTDVKCKAGVKACSACVAGQYKIVDNSGTLAEGGGADKSWIRTLGAAKRAWTSADENQCKCCASGKYASGQARTTDCTAETTSSGKVECPAGTRGDGRWQMRVRA